MTKGMSEQPNTNTVAQRLEIVLNWIQAIILISLLSASASFLVLSRYEGPGLLWVAAVYAAITPCFGLVTATISYVIWGHFRILPVRHRRLVKRLVLVIPLSLALVIVIAMEVS